MLQQIDLEKFAYRIISNRIQFDGDYSETTYRLKGEYYIVYMTLVDPNTMSESILEALQSEDNVTVEGDGYVVYLEWDYMMDMVSLEYTVLW